MRQRCILLLALILFLSACGKTEPEVPEGPVLWFCADSAESHGPALAAQPYHGELRPEALLAALLAGPERENLYSPFPRGVSLVQCQWDEERPGVLLVSLSEQYGALADISLTLADYCIVLTLSQAEGVEGVEISTQGYQASYRSHQLLAAGEALLYEKTLDNPAVSR